MKKPFMNIQLFADSKAPDNKGAETKAETKTATPKLNIAEYTKLANAKAQAKAEAVFKSMLKQNGVSDAEIPKYMENFKASKSVKVDNEWKSKYEALVKENENKTRSDLIRAKLNEMGADPKLSDLLVGKVKLDDLKFDEKGSATNIDDLINPLKTEYSDFFGKTAQRGYKPISSGSTTSQNPVTLKSAIKEAYEKQLKK